MSQPDTSSPPLVVGLTGGTGVGKSTAGVVFGQLGAEVVDCDQLGRDVVAPGGAALDQIFERFGDHLRAEDGTLDRAGLAGIVFDDPVALDALNSITHPAIDDLIASRIDAAGDVPMVVLDMAVLVESNLGAGQYHKVVVVEADTERRLDRLEERGMSRDDARSRIASQASDEERRAMADYVIENNGSLDQLKAEVRRVFVSLTN